MSKNTFYIATAIDYVNAAPHIGHAYQKIAADVLARWHKLQGDDVLFVTGTDEYGKKVARSALAQGKDPQTFVDEVSKTFQEAWKALNIQPDRFIRTTDADHTNTVHKLTKTIADNGDIYKGEYAGLYCVGCESYFTEKEAENGQCPIHKKDLEILKEESYFFKLSKYQKFLLDHYKKHPEFILPEERRNEIVNRVKEGLNDLSITRTSIEWGVPFPLDEKHKIYVWWEALQNYYTATDNPEREHYWPTTVHVLGKDNSWFHCVIWPALLHAAGIALPINTFNHGFLTFNGEKISKSLGNAIGVQALVEHYGADTVRYFCLRHFPFGEDGDFSEQALIERHNSELADKLGNLVSRVSTLIEKYGLEATDPLDSQKTYAAVKEHIQNYALDKALQEVFTFVDYCNEYIQEHKPWESKDTKVLWQLANAIKDIAILLSPFIPESAEKIAKTFNFDISLKTLEQPLAISKVKKAEVLFKKLNND